MSRILTGGALALAGGAAGWFARDFLAPDGNPRSNAIRAPPKLAMFNNISGIDVKLTRTENISVEGPKDGKLQFRMPNNRSTFATYEYKGITIGVRTEIEE